MNVRASWSGGRRFCFNAALNEVFITMDRPKTPVFLVPQTQSLARCQSRLPSLLSYCKVLAIKSLASTRARSNCRSHCHRRHHWHRL
jgi:hypothetical protein